MSTTTSAAHRERIPFIDEVRGFDLILMVVFHGFYTAGWVFRWPIGKALFLFFRPVEPFFAALFIVICGISCRLSRNNWKRGGALLGIAAAMSLILWFCMRDSMIYFGILHFLAVSILLFALLRPLLDKIPAAVLLPVCAVLFILTWGVPYINGSYFGIRGWFTWPVPADLVQNPWLYPLGLGTLDGADYFPLLPWFFCFLAGTALGRWAAAGRFPRWMYTSRARWLAWLGRHTLLIYVVHQPVLYGIGWLLSLCI